MAVAARKQRARHMHRQVERTARTELLVVEVAAVRARHDGADAAPMRRRRHAHHAEERVQRQVQAPRHARGLALDVKRDVDHAVLVELAGQCAGERPDHVVAPVLAQTHVEDADLERVARLGALDVDRPGQDMARQAARAAGMDLEQFGRHMEARRRQRIGAAADRVDRQRVAAGDAQHRRVLGVEQAPMASLDAGGQVVRAHANRPRVEPAQGGCSAVERNVWRSRGLGMAVILGVGKQHDDARTVPAPAQSPALGKHRLRCGLP